MVEKRIIHGWLVDPDTREALLALYPPRYERVIAEHVTYKPGADGAALPDAVDCLVVGRADDGKGVEALVVSISGSTDRPDGSTWHITWSLAEGRRAKESNGVIATLGWEAFAQPYAITLIPGWWKWIEGR